MASNPKDPTSRFYEQDIVNGNRSNFNWSYKNRLSADFGYLIPVGLWDVPADSNFTLDVVSSVSTNPTLAPILGKVKYRMEAYFVEKAAYVSQLRNNDRLPVDRDVPFPVIGISIDPDNFVPRCSLLEYLQMYPAGAHEKHFNRHPAKNAIPLLMYYDIYRNYYVNPQDDEIPVRVSGYVPGISAEFPGNAIEDIYIRRVQLDDLFDTIRNVPHTGLFSHIKNAFLDNGIPLPFGSYDFQSDGNDTNVVPEKTHQAYKHRGLMRRTLNNDFFTSFISNANVELMKSRANVAVTSLAGQGIINVEQISLANRNWRIATRSLLWGTDWKDYNKVHYGVNLMIPYGKPQFLGALSSDLTFNDVISQAQTGAQDSSVNANVNLGSRAAIGFGGLKNYDGHFVEFTTKDEGYVMVVASLVPEVDYYQGSDPMYSKINLRHSWMYELNSVGMQDFELQWASYLPSATDTTRLPFENFNIAPFKVPIWFEFMARYNQLHGEFTSDNLMRYWVFARPFQSLETLFPGVFNEEDEHPSPYMHNFSTYCLPEMFNYIFANNLGSDNFQLQIRWDAKCNNMLDKQVISYL